jgi:hypothetical protein
LKFKQTKIGSVKGKMNDSKQGRDGIHDKETHGRSGDIDENTSPQKIKAPNLIERAKEEVEALVIAIHHPNKDHHHQTHGILHSSTGVILFTAFNFCLFTALRINFHRLTDILLIKCGSPYRSK